MFRKTLKLKLADFLAGWVDESIFLIPVKYSAIEHLMEFEVLPIWVRKQPHFAMNTRRQAD